MKKICMFICIFTFVLISAVGCNDFQNIEMGKLKYTIQSPKGDYKLLVYINEEEGGVLVKRKKQKGKVCNIFWQGNIDSCYIVWKNQYTAIINGVVLDIRKEQYDYRKSDEGESFYGKKQENPLYSALLKGNIEKIDKMMTKENIENKDQDGITPLMIAAYMGAEDDYKNMIKKGADVSMRNVEGQGVQEYTIRSGLSEKYILKFLKQSQKEGNAITQATIDAVEQPWKYNWEEASCNYEVYQFVKRQAEKNGLQMGTMKDEEKVFMDVATGQKKKVTTQEMKLRDQDGNSLFLIAAGYGNMELLKNILAKEENVIEKNRFQQDALLYSISKEQWNATEYLLKNGFTDSKALQEVAKTGNIKGANLILKYLDLEDDWHLKEAIDVALDYGYDDFAYELFLKMKNKDYKGDSDSVYEKAKEVEAEKIIEFVNFHKM